MPLARLYRQSPADGARAVQGAPFLIDQSLHARLGATTTNGDGFGLGWYARPAPDGSLEPPFRYRSVHPAWNDRNLREAARAIHSSLFVAHIRAATDTPAQKPTAIRSAMATGCSCTTA